MAAGYQIDLDTLPPLVLPAAKQEHLKYAYTAWRRALLNGEDYGLEPLTFQACHVLVQVYREANKEIIGTGRQVGRACIEAVRTPGTLHEIAKCRIWSTGSWLIIQLPSERRLFYAKPKLHTERQVDLETGKEKFYEYLSYMATRGRSWIRERAWAGLFIENIVQAIANDVLRDALRLVHRDALSVPEIATYLDITGEETAISLHVHDEITLDVPKNTYPLARLLKCMTTDLLAECAWMKGLPLSAAGWTGIRYKKG
jgi:DNA polymerase